MMMKLSKEDIEQIEAFLSRGDEHIRGWIHVPREPFEKLLNAYKKLAKEDE